MRELHIVKAGQMPENIEVVGERITVLAAGDGSKRFEVHVQEGVQGGGPPLHRHPWDEAFYVLEGAIEVTARGRTEALPAGSYVHIPAGTVHAYRNLTPTAKILGVVSDPKGGEFFAAVDRLRVPEDVARLNAIAASFGLEFMPAGAEVSAA